MRATWGIPDWCTFTQVHFVGMSQVSPQLSRAQMYTCVLVSVGYAACLSCT